MKNIYWSKDETAAVVGQARQLLAKNGETPQVSLWKSAQLILPKKRQRNIHNSVAYKLHKLLNGAPATPDASKPADFDFVSIENEAKNIMARAMVLVPVLSLAKKLEVLGRKNNDTPLIQCGQQIQANIIAAL